MADDAFSVLASAMTPYKVTAAGVNSQGQFIDANGQPITEYQQPNWFERALNPQAQQIASLNAQAQAYPLARQQEQNVQRNLMGQNVDTVPWQEWSSTGDTNLGTPQRAVSNPLDTNNSNLFTGLVSNQNSFPDYHSAVTGSPTLAGANNIALTNRQRQLEITRHLDPSFNPTAINTQLAGQAAMPYAASTGGLIARGSNIMANTDVTNANAEQVLAQNRLRNISSIAQLDTQTLSNQIMAGTLTGQELIDAIKLHPDLAIIAQNKATLDKATSGAQVTPTNLNKTVQTIGNQVDTGATNSGTENLIAHQNSYLSPTLNRLQGTGDIWNLMHNNTNLRTLPGAGSIQLNPDGSSSVIPGRYMTPEIMAAQAIMQNGGNILGTGAAQPTNAPPGIPSLIRPNLPQQVMPPQYTSPGDGSLQLHGQTVPEVPTKTEEQQDEEDKQNAILAHNLAIHNTAIAQHKEEQARLKAQTLIGHTRAGLGLYRTPDTHFRNSRTGELIGVPGDVIAR